MVLIPKEVAGSGHIGCDVVPGREGEAVRTCYDQGG
jgi:hypothetical protein